MQNRSSLSKLAYHERTRREILVKSDLIPPLPDVVVRVLALLNAGDAEPGQLEGQLQHDPVLVAKMLGIVNSPFYGLSRRVACIRDAVMVLGFRGLRSLLLASSTAKYLKRDFRFYGHDQDGLWRHSLAVASAAKAIAARIGRDAEVREELFVAGLLHDIGKMLLAPYVREHESRRTAGVDAVTFERDVLGIDHAEAAALVAAKWNLSETVQTVLAHHHDPLGAEPMRVQVAIVRLADDLAHGLTTGYAPGQAPPPRDPREDLVALEVPAAAWREVRAHVEETARTALSQLETVGS